MTIELTRHHCEILTELLEQEHRHRVHELHRTDALGYKRLLRERIAVIEELCEQIAVLETAG